MTLGDVLSDLRKQAALVGTLAQPVKTLALQIEVDLRKSPPPSQSVVLARAADLAHATADLAGALGGFADETTKALDGLTRTS
jgi:hypothetical protein